jgi:cytosine/adenosine deaminase-related metal-dependent hydrolase
MDPSRRVIDNGAVAIAAGRIAAVGAAAEVGAAVNPARIVTATRKVVLPGFIDVHAHAGHSLTKSIGWELPTAEWAKLLDVAYFHATTPAYWHADGLLSGVERLRFGTTTAAMMLGSMPRTDAPEYGQAFARGASISGGRTLVSVGPPSPPWPRSFTTWRDGVAETRDVSYDRCIAVTEELIQHWTSGATPRVGAMVGPARFAVPSRQDLFYEDSNRLHGEAETCDARRLANDYHVPIHTHAYGEVIEYLSAHMPDLLGADVLLIHCTSLSPREVEILAERNVKVGHCPTARRPYLGHRCPVPELIDAGVIVAVASDASAPDRSYDLFETMRTAQRLQRAHFANPNYLPPEKMLESVTIDAADAIGMAAEIGSLEVGKRADIILVDMARPHLSPAAAPVPQLIHYALGSDVSEVFVDGTLVLSGGHTVSVDEEQVMQIASLEASSMFRRAGLESFVTQRSDFWRKSRT